MKINVHEVAYHRNGIGGAGFYVVRFTSEDGPMLGVVFEARDHVAVFHAGKLAAGIIGFTENSWRGDVYEPLLRQAVVAFGNAATQDQNYGVPSWKPAAALVIGAMLALAAIGCQYEPLAVPPATTTDAGCTPGDNATDCCGNGLCEPWETILAEAPTFCPADCHCGDGTCDPGYGEDQPALFCAADCGCEAIDDCSGDTTAPAGCECRPDCGNDDTGGPPRCCPDACNVCGLGC